jgi:hypothetical protein
MLSKGGITLGPGSLQDLVVALAEVAGLVAIILIWLIGARRTDAGILFGGAFAAWLTGGIAAFLLTRVATHDSTQRWVVILGAVLAGYIELYWSYAAYRSGLHRQRSARRWPEGPEKDATL